MDAQAYSPSLRGWPQEDPGFAKPLATPSPASPRVGQSGTVSRAQTMDSRNLRLQLPESLLSSS